MKQFIFLFLLIHMLIASTWQNIHSDTPTNTHIEIIESDINHTVIEFNIEGFHLVPIETANGIMNTAKIHDGASHLLMGFPDLSKFARSIVIPDNKSMKVNIFNSEYRDYQNILIAPSKGNLSRNINPNDVEFEFGDVYDKDAFFPNNIVELGTPYILRSMRGQTIIFNPLQYNPISKVLRVYTSINVEIIEDGTSNVNVLSRNHSKNKLTQEFYNIYNSHFLNFKNDTRFDYLIDQGSMLIIAYDSFYDTMLPLLDWKNRKGLPTEMVRLSEVGASTTSIQNYISTLYYNSNLTFVLLVGDIAQIPSPNSGGSMDPTYGHIEGNDYYAEVIIGRFSGSNLAHIETQVERSIAYETNPDNSGDWYDNALGVASNQGPGMNGFTDDDFNDWLWNTLLSTFTYDSYEGIYDGSGGSDSQGINAINNGVSIINYTGHGSISSWGNGASLSSSQINSLTNNDKLPFVITVGCNVGEFESTNECFTETWMRATNNNEPAGSIAHLGSSISQSWEPPMHGQWAMNSILTENYNQYKTRTIGGISVNGCMHMNDAQGSSGTNETKHWTLFGDPSIPIRTAAPTNMTVIHDDVIIIGSSEFLVSTGSEGDLVALSRNGELLASGYTNGLGNVNLELGTAAAIPGELDFVVTGFNKFPYETTVMVLSPDGAYVLVESLSFTAGNGSNNEDEIIQFGETVNLSLNLENVGNDDATGVEVDLSIDDPYITITTGATTVFNLASDNSYNTEGFEFEVDANVPNEYDFEISCIIAANGEIWESSLNFTAYAPVIEVSSVVGSLDPGISTTIEANLLNAGGSDIHSPMVSVSGDSYVTVNESSFTNAYVWDNGDEIDNAEVLTLSVYVSPTTPIGHIAEFTITVNSNQPPTTAYENNVIFTIPVGQVTANFENGFQNNLDWELTSYPWTISDNSSNTGNYSIQSGQIGNNQESSISITLDIVIDGEIDFYYKVSSEYSTSGSYFYDGLQFYIDNTLIDQYQPNSSGESPWTNATYPVTEGQHTFTWTYIKDGAGGSTDCTNTGCDDSAYLDDITFPPASIETDELLGDLNNDSLINILDVVIVINNIIEDSYNASADLNMDNQVNILDVILLVNIVIGR